MRLIPAPHVIRPALFQLQNVARHTFIYHQTTPALIRVRSSARRLYSTQFPPSIDDDMGKDDKSGKNFNLKVPKGTRDCTFFLRKEKLHSTISLLPFPNPFN